MRELLRKCGLVVTLIGLRCLSLGIGDAQEISPQGPPPTANDSLKAFLQKYVRQQSSKNYESTEYSAAFVDLNGDGKKEAIVYLEGRWWCGSGGVRL